VVWLGLTYPDEYERLYEREPLYVLCRASSGLENVRIPKSATAIVRRDMPAYLDSISPNIRLSM
jgi:hypothetical protein